MSNDDLTPFENDPVFRALTGPASPEELSGEAAALAAFRTANGAKPHRRFAARIGTSGGVIIAAVALSSGVAAAAYSNSLPESVQHFAHIMTDWLPVAAVPAPAADKPSPPPVVTGPSGNGSVPGNQTGGPSGTSTGAPAPVTGSPAPKITPSATPTKSHAHPTSSPTISSSPSSSPTPTPSTSTSPTTSPTPTPTPTDTSTPTPTPTATVAPPAAISISVSQTRIPADAGVEIIGALTDGSGQPVVGHQVSAYARLSNGGGTDLLAVSQSGPDGSVQFETPALTQTVSVMLRVGGGVHSAAVRVVVVPTLSAAVTQGGAQDAISISAQGGQSGDGLSVYEREHGSWVLVDSLNLDSSGNTAFDATPDPKRTVRYRGVLSATGAHASATVLFVTAPSGAKK